MVFLGEINVILNANTKPKAFQVRFDKQIELGENEKVEFKSSFNQEVIESVCAFANKRGGTIFIGLKSREKVLGLQIGEESLQQRLNEIKSKTEPF